jgi:two-component system, NarL family, response regulator NreC
MAITVLLAMHHALLRHGTHALLREAGGFHVVAEAADARQALHLASALEPDVVLLDVELPAQSGRRGVPGIQTYDVPELLRQLAALGIRSRVLLVGTRTVESQVLSYIHAGAAGLLLKDASPGELACALGEVHRAAFYVSSEVSIKLLNRWHHSLGDKTSDTDRAAGPAATGDASSVRSAVFARQFPQAVAPALSEREREVLAYVAAGWPNRQIAKCLQISVKTVEAHKANMVTRLGLRGTSDLVRFAMQAAVRAEESSSAVLVQR